MLGSLAIAALGGCGGSPAEEARDAAIGYFAHEVRRPDPTWANLLGYLHRRFGVEVTSASGLPLHEVPDDPERPELSALFRRLGDPNAATSKATIAALPTAIDRITASALHCDRIALPADWPAILRRASELGGYALTHAALAGEWSLENGCFAWEDLGALQHVQVDLLVDMASDRVGLAEQFSASDDLWIEALVMLYYLRADSRVRSEWIEELLSLQRGDGGWAARPGLDRSDAHATALALWVVLENAQPHAPPITWIPQR